MDPINNHHHAETSPLSKKGSDSLSADDLKIQQIASRVLSNPLAKSPSIGERVVTSSADPADLQFVKSLITRSIVDLPLTLSDEDLLRIEKINKTLKTLPLDGFINNKELNQLLITLYDNQDFIKAISDHDLKNITKDKKAFDKIKKHKRLSCKKINKLLSIYSNQTNKKYQQYPSYQSLMTDLSDYINDLAFQNSILAKLYDEENGLDQLTLKEILKLPIHNVDFKKFLEIKISKFSNIKEEILFQFFKSLTFNQLYEIFSADANYTVTLNNHSLTTGDCIAIFNSFEFDFFEYLENIIKNEDPIQAIDLLQRLKIAYRKENFDLSGLNIDLETEASAGLFTHRKEARGGISQVNFKDDGLAITEGGANFCCGSIAVEALVSKLANRTIEDVIKNGVIRHLKLPKEQMSTRTKISMLIANNKDIKGNGAKIKKSLDPNKTLYSGYLDLLSKIPGGFSGLILADTNFFMYSENPDRFIEIFDSHGSSIPLITGVTHPAYRAFFENKESAAAYLSVHRKVDIDRDLYFFPLEIVPS